MSDLGNCQVEGCGHPAVVGLNRKFVCGDHIESEMAAVFAPVSGLKATISSSTEKT